MVNMPLNKETKPNWTTGERTWLKTIIYITLYIDFSVKKYEKVVQHIPLAVNCSSLKEQMLHLFKWVIH